MQRLTALLAALGSATLLSGCANSPQLVAFPAKAGTLTKTESVSTLTVQNIIDHINCELKQADIDGRLSAAPGYKISVAMTLKVDDSMGTTPSLTYSTPLKVAGDKFGATVGGEYTRGQQRTFNATYTIDGKKLASLPDCPANSAPKFTPGLVGDLGVKEIVDDAMRSYDRTDSTRVDIKADGTGAPNFNSTVQFTFTKALSSGGLTWTLHRYTGPGTVFKKSRVDTDSVIFGFSPTGPKAKQEQIAAAADKAKASRASAAAARATANADQAIFNAIVQKAAGSGPMTQFISPQFMQFKDQLARSSADAADKQAEADADQKAYDTLLQDSEKADANAIANSQAAVMNAILQNLQGTH